MTAGSDLGHVAGAKAHRSGGWRRRSAALNLLTGGPPRAETDDGGLLWEVGGGVRKRDVSAQGGPAPEPLWRGARDEHIFHVHPPYRNNIEMGRSSRYAGMYHTGNERCTRCLFGGKSACAEKFRRRPEEIARVDLAPVAVTPYPYAPTSISSVLYFQARTLRYCRCVCGSASHHSSTLIFPTSRNQSGSLESNVNSQSSAVD